MPDSDPEADVEPRHREIPARRHRDSGVAEYQARDEANRGWLHETFAAATQSGAPAVVIARSEIATSRWIAVARG